MKRINLLLVMLMLAAFLSGCAEFSDPPLLEDADLFLKNNQHDLDVVVNFLKTIDADHAFISRYETTVFYEFEDHEIISDEVRTSLRNLWSAGCLTISINHSNNTVFFEIWKRTIGDVSGGVSCTLDGHGYPKAEFQTECTPISNGWFYYLADYEEYRKSPSKYDEMWDRNTD